VGLEESVQTVSTVFLHKANGVGFLDPSSEDNNVSCLIIEAESFGFFSLLGLVMIICTRLLNNGN
jgi:hypothetical protein